MESGVQKSPLRPYGFSVEGGLSVELAKRAPEEEERESNTMRKQTRADLAHFLIPFWDS